MENNHPITQLHSEMIKHFERILNPQVGDIRKSMHDLYETETKVVASFELPGVDKKDIQLNLIDHIVEVKVARENAVHNKDIQSVSKQQFHSAVQLPRHADTAKPEVNYRNGILTIAFPKTIIERKRIDIQ